jgi:hypothetical protein
MMRMTGYCTIIGTGPPREAGHPGTIMTSDAPIGDIEWIAQPWGRVLRVPALADVAEHFFTDRQLRLRGPGTEELEWGLVARAIGVEPGRLFRPRQVHGRSVVFLPRGCEGGHFGGGRRPEADALISDDPSRALAVQVADCVPILIADPRTGAVAAVHAGWRGTAAGVVQAAVAGLEACCGTRTAGLVAALGPSIGPCCYEVGPEVAEAFRAAGHRDTLVENWFRRGPGLRFRLDLWMATRDQLMSAGVEPRHVHIVGMCTAHDTARFHSYRAEGNGTGRMAAVIRARR